jgi:hypothetical protein
VGRYGVPAAFGEGRGGIGAAPLGWLAGGTAGPLVWEGVRRAPRAPSQALDGAGASAGPAWGRRPLPRRAGQAAARRTAAGGVRSVTQGGLHGPVHVQEKEGGPSRRRNYPDPVITV